MKRTTRTTSRLPSLVGEVDLAPTSPTAIRTTSADPSAGRVRLPTEVKPPYVPKTPLGPMTCVGAGFPLITTGLAKPRAVAIPVRNRQPWQHQQVMKYRGSKDARCAPITPI